METTVHGGRSSSGSSSSSATGSGDGSETLEQLSANALQQLLKLADATQQLAALFKLLPLEDGSFPPDEQQQQDEEMAVVGEHRPPAAAAAGTAAANAGAAVVAAVMRRLPQLTACIDKLMLNSCFKEAHTCVECLVLLGRQLNTPAPNESAAAAGGAAGGAAGVQRQQQQVPAHAELSRWAAESALQQEEPEVKSVSLAKALLDVYIRFCGEERCAVCWMCMCRSYPLLTASAVHVQCAGCKCADVAAMALVAYSACSACATVPLGCISCKTVLSDRPCLFTHIKCAAMSAQCSVLSAFATYAQCAVLLCARLVQGRMT
jgi:hypothetical protein